MTAMGSSDFKQCQAMVREPAFLTHGFGTTKRCTNVPTVLLRQTKCDPGKTEKGSMVLCSSCLLDITARYHFEFPFELIPIVEHQGEEPPEAQQ